MSKIFTHQKWCKQAENEPEEQENVLVLTLHCELNGRPVASVKQSSNMKWAHAASRGLLRSHPRAGPNGRCVSVTK